MPEVPVSVALKMKPLLRQIWQEFRKRQPVCPRCGARWAEYGWDHPSVYSERISARCRNFHEFIIDFDDDFIIEEVKCDDDETGE
jgi:hypothetical protein